MPWITDYHVMSNKRYVLTNDSQKKAVLWSITEARPVKEWQSKSFKQVQSLLTENYDLKKDTPSSWFQTDIKLGSLTIHIDPDKWNKTIAGEV